MSGKRCKSNKHKNMLDKSQAKYPGFHRKYSELKKCRELTIAMPKHHDFYWIL